MATTAYHVESFYESETNTATHVLVCNKTKKCAVIDCVLHYDMISGKTTPDQLEDINKYIQKENLDLEWILETHAHADHISGAPYLKKMAGKGKIAIGEHITKVQTIFNKLLNLGLETNGSQFDVLLKDGGDFKVGELVLTAISTPGHTPACMTYYLKDELCFCGDTIFQPDQGTARCDFPEGSSDLLWSSIQKILSFPDNVKIYTCHDYQPGNREVQYLSTVAQQKAANIHVKQGTEKTQFISWRDERDKTLSLPRLIVPSIQCNVNAGYFPKPESNGTVYLKTPVNLLKGGEGALSK